MNNINPLLASAGLPSFNEIKPEHIEPALDYMLEHNRNQIVELVKLQAQPTWENFMQPLEELSDRLEKIWAPVSHLNAVKDGDEWRSAYQTCLAKLTEYAAEMGQNQQLFAKFNRLIEGAGYAGLSAAQKMAVENELRDFRLSGIHLSAEKQTRFRQISQQLSQLGNQFSQNILDATDAWELHVESLTELAGLPQSALDQAHHYFLHSHHHAEQKGEQGWIFTLKAPSYIPFMTYADNRKLRERMYRAYVTRASEIAADNQKAHSKLDGGKVEGGKLEGGKLEGGKWDNSGIICETLALRHEHAALLGFPDYAAYSLATKMAENADEVAAFLRDLVAKSRAPALLEIKQLEDYARLNLGIEKLEPWDYAWASEKLKMALYQVSDEDLRPYFPLPRVLQGMFQMVEKLFGIRIIETATDQSKDQSTGVQTWANEVQFFTVTDQQNTDQQNTAQKNPDGQSAIRGYFYIDLFARPHKRGGAWMAECVSRRKSGKKLQHPVAFLTCNFTPPLNHKQSLLTHDQVTTLFHEFGHTLHHILTKVEVAAVAGINGVPWDAVELPSQLLENWCWDRQALKLISGHYESGEPLPHPLLDKMKQARNFQSAMQMLRQIEFSLFDLEIHRPSPPSTPREVREILARIRAQVAVVKSAKFNRFENSFEHIFAGGYAAGYYSYQWAEVLSADAFGKFEEQGLFNPACGREFLEKVLERGGSVDPMTLFVDFRGRKPNVDALLRNSGLS